MRASLEAIAGAEPGVLIHCAAGRDRTGLISTILLANAGVSPEDIFGDYASSVQEMAGAAAHGGPTVDRQADWDDTETDAFLESVRPFVIEFAANVSGHLDRLSIEQQARVRLRNLLTC